MRFRESGMPDETIWNTFFSPDDILDKMDVVAPIPLLVDIGCGYGTFLFAASQRVVTAIGIDIDRQMINHCNIIKFRKKIRNVSLIHNDISLEITNESIEHLKLRVDYVTIFNLLHCEEPVKLLTSAKKLLNNTGKIGVIHWRYGKTPRGPSMEIRPKPEHLINWACESGLETIKSVDLPPYHFGIVFKQSE